MIKRELVIDGYNIQDQKNFSVKGHMNKIYEVSELEREFMTHKFDNRTLKIMFWAQLNLDYIGG